MNPNIHNSTLSLSVSSLYLLLLLRTFHIGNHINLSSALPSSFSSTCSNSPLCSMYFSWLVLLFLTFLFSLFLSFSVLLTGFLFSFHSCSFFSLPTLRHLFFFSFFFFTRLLLRFFSLFILNQYLLFKFCFSSLSFFFQNLRFFVHLKFFNKLYFYFFVSH